MQVTGNTYSGSATGSRYSASLNAVINTAGGHCQETRQAQRQQEVSMLNWLWYEATPIDAEKWQMIRQYRDELLARCDWTQTLDAVMDIGERAAWADYRQ